jgi:hypothetical protein
MGKRGKRVV